jgi:Anti-sigma-K factor rskA
MTIAVIATVALDQRFPPHRPTPPANATHAVLRRVGTHGELVVSGMPAPPIGEVYEVWLEHANRSPHPTDALFTVTRAGDGSVDVPGPLRGVRDVIVTSEPLGGSSTPTSAPVLRLRVSH